MMTRDELLTELNAAVEELVTAVEATAHPQITKPPLEVRRRIAAAMHQLDGTNLAAVKLLTGHTTEELNDLGGVPEEN